MSTRKCKRHAIHLISAFLFLILDKNVLLKGFKVPAQCTNYRNLTEGNRNTKNKPARIPLCDAQLLTIGWYRFVGPAGNMLPSKHVRAGMCGAQNPGWLLGDHPCIKYDTADAQVCFVHRTVQCKTRVNISITLCGEYYVYQLPGVNCSTEKRRYCGEDNKVPALSCNVTSTPVYSHTSTTAVNTSTMKPDLRPTSPCTTERDNNSIFKGKETFRDLKKEVDALERTNTSREDQRRVAKQIINKLSNLTDLDVADEEQQRNGLHQQNLIDTVRILQKIVGLNISDSSLKILVPANNILDLRNSKSWRNIKDNKVLRSLIITLENYGFQEGENMKRNTSVNFNFQNHSNVQLHTMYVKHPGSFAEEERLFKFPDASFELSRSALPQRSNSSAVVVVMWYKTLDSFMRNSLYGDKKPVYAKVKSKIIIASVRPEVKVKFKEPVRIRWKITHLNDSETCVYWKPELKENRWKRDGCQRVKDKLASDRFICECDHLTAFAAMDISGDMVDEVERQSLELISTVGCSLSLCGIFLTILTHAFLWKRLQQNAKSRVPSQVLMHLCVAIGMIDILAILTGPALNHQKFCITLSILLYLFVLAVFGWMLCEGIIIYLQLVNVYTGLGLGGRHLKVFYVIGWGIPITVVAVLVALSDPEDFITSHACWCRAGGVLFWVFLGTVGLILLINIVIFILALRSALSSSEVSTTRTLNKTKGSTSSTETTARNTLRKAKVGLKGSAVLLPLLGLTWTFGLLVFNRDTIVFKYLFAICNSLQGLMIFIFHVLINRKVHEAISREKKARKARNVTFAMPNNNTCGTLTTSDCSPRKSSLATTPFFGTNFNNSFVEHNATEEHKNGLNPSKNKCASSNGIILEDLEH